MDDEFNEVDESALEDVNVDEELEEEEYMDEDEDEEDFDDENDDDGDADQGVEEAQEEAAATAEAPAEDAQTSKTKKGATEAQLLAAEAVLREKYPHIIEGSIRDVDRDKESVHFNKRTVEIQCTAEDCTETRRIATSDLHQVKYCDAHAAIQRKNRRKEYRKSKKAK